MSRPLILVAATGLFFALACGLGEEAEDMTTALKGFAEAVEKEASELNLDEAAKNLQQAVEQMGESVGGADPVPFQDLKALLPKKLKGHERTEATGEKTTMSGIGTSQAKGVYEAKDGGHIEIQILDIGGMSGMIRTATFAWAAVEMEREWDDGFERTATDKDGVKRFEKYDESDQRGEINGLVGGRFVVSIQGRNVDFAALEKAMEKVDRKGLVAMKDHGVKEPTAAE